jgi:hypothetical protein
MSSRMASSFSCLGERTMSVPVLGPFCVVTISMLHVAVVDGR